MKRTVSILFVVAIAVQGCGLLGGTPEPVIVSKAVYQPFVASYRGVSSGRTTQRFDDQPTETDFGLEYFVSTQVVGREGGLAATLVLDSVALFTGASGGISSAQVDSARGASYRAALADDGRLVDFAGGERCGSLARELSDRLLKSFFPTIPRG